jgi:hypothetical protein
MGAQEPSDSGPCETVSGRGGRGNLQECPQPEIISRGAEGQRLGVEADELLAQAIGEADERLEEVIVQAGEFTELDDEGILGSEVAEGGPIGAQGIAQDEGVASIIFGAGDGVTVAESVELLGVDGEDVKAALEHGLDDGPARNLDGDRDARRASAGQLGEPVGQLGEGLAGMRDGAFGDQVAVGVEHGHLVRGRGPVDADIERVRALSHDVPCGAGRSSGASSVPVLALAARLPTGRAPSGGSPGRTSGGGAHGAGCSWHSAARSARLMLSS